MADKNAAPAGVDANTLKSNEIARSVLSIGVSPSNFRVEFRNGVAHVHGSLKTEEERQRVLSAVRGNAGVKEVKDELQVGAAAGGRSAGGTYTVKAGDNLSKIAKDHYGDASHYKRIFEANRDILSDADEIQPGQVLKLP